MKRVSNKARKIMGKTSRREDLDKILKKYDLNLEVPFESGLSIDTNLPAAKSAKMIAQHYKLRDYTAKRR